jgi:ribosome recycling factor
MLEEVLKRAKDHMQKALENLHHELAGIRTGKANPGLLDAIRVDYFGQMVPLKQVANIAVPDPRLITIQPWDKSVVAGIEKAIMASDLGLNPQSDGVIIRLPVPPLTEERRRDLVKVVKRMGEESKVAVRNVRRDSNDRIKKLEKEHEISEDAMHDKQDEIQKITDEFTQKIDESVAAKEKEIMEI